MIKKILVLAGTVVCIIIVALIFGPDENNHEGKPRVKIGGKVLYIEIADTPELRQRGLSGRESIERDDGMLFIPDFAKPGIWMKNMKFSLDIIWVGTDNKIIGIEKKISPDTYPQAFFPPASVSYVIEVNSGWTEKNNIGIGDELKFE